MFRTDIPKDGGMLFWPYPADGGPPRAASFWMKNTPSPLDIIYIRPDHTIARIAENTTPYSTDPILSGEPVGAVPELHGGCAAELAIGVEDAVTCPGENGCAGWERPAGRVLPGLGSAGRARIQGLQTG